MAPDPWVRGILVKRSVSDVAMLTLLCSRLAAAQAADKFDVASAADPFD
jgi:hypothetical protein